MNLTKKKKIVILGMLSRNPVAGIAWLTMQYLVGFKRLGYDVYYVEAHAGTPKMFITKEDDGSTKAASYIADAMQFFDLGDKWAYHALHSNGWCYGMSINELHELYKSAHILFNLHGGTTPLDEHVETGRLVYLGTDPVEREIDLYHNDPETIELMEAHCAHFTWGENYGNPDCQVPVSDRFQFHPTRQPIIMDLWNSGPSEAGDAFTSIGSWRQLWREVKFKGEVYHWSKHVEFRKFIDLPKKVDQDFELALAGLNDQGREHLKNNGWRLLDGLDVSSDIAGYCTYIQKSKGEFTVAKDQNVRLRSGWFSDRSACYLAAGRPVITQDTAFGNVLPTGNGLFPFSTMEDIISAIDTINSNYSHHARAALDIANEYFSYDIVLPRLLNDIGL